MSTLEERPQNFFFFLFQYKGINEGVDIGVLHLAYCVGDHFRGCSSAESLHIPIIPGTVAEMKFQMHCRSISSTKRVLVIL